MFGWTIVRVDGHSMVPTLSDGDFVVAHHRPAKLSDVIVIDHPEFGPIIKRITAANSDGTFVVAGDGAASTLPSKLGDVEPAKVVGVVRWRIGRGGVYQLQGHNAAKF